MAKTTRQAARYALRLTKLLDGCKALGIPITVVDDTDEGRKVFSENVDNCSDDPDVTRLDRYVLIGTPDERFDDFSVENFRSRESLQSGLRHWTASTVVAVFDLDGNKVLRPEWKTTVTLTHPKEWRTR